MPAPSTQLDADTREAINVILESICKAFGFDVVVLFAEGPGDLEALAVGTEERFKPISKEIIDAVKERAARLAADHAARN